LEKVGFAMPIANLTIVTEKTIFHNPANPAKKEGKNSN